MHHRQIPVQHHHVVVVHVEEFQGGAAVVGQVHRVRVAAQPFGHRVGQQRFVLDHQNAHPDMVTGGGVTSA